MRKIKSLYSILLISCDTSFNEPVREYDEDFGTDDVLGNLQKGDLVWLDFNPQSGHEQKGRRPAICISQKKYNQISEAGSDSTS